MSFLSRTRIHTDCVSGGNDSGSFSWILNGIDFKQDGLKYVTRTHPSNADLYDRVQKDRVMQGSMIEAWFTYNATAHPEMLPRIPTPEPPEKWPWAQKQRVWPQT